ncbi:MAG: outer membrane beta-barrel protein [Hymenobacter sp.]|nr:outer membrane beta-barrel protein [Hymenobacter sp.]
MTSLFRAFLLLALPWLGACSSSLYFPPPPQVPLLTQKGEWSAGLHTNIGQNTAVQGAYAVSDHFGVMASASFLHANKKQSFFGSKTERETQDHDFVEGGLGYFTRLRNDRRVLEIYGGLGVGSTRRTEFNDETNLTSQVAEGKLTKYFVQVNYTSKKKKSFHALGRDWPFNYGSALRASYVQLHDFRLDNAAQAPEDNVFLEPITYTRIQVLGPLQLQLISGSNFGLRTRKYLRASNSVFQLGMVVNFGGQEGGK